MRHNNCDGFEPITNDFELGSHLAMIMADFSNFKEYFVRQVFAFFAKAWGTKYARQSFFDHREEKVPTGKGVGSRFIFSGKLKINADRQGGASGTGPTAKLRECRRGTWN